VRAGAIVRKLIVCASTGALACLALASGASAAMVQVSDNGDGTGLATVAMGSAVSNLTLSSGAGGLRIHEDGDALTLSLLGANVAGCSDPELVTGDIVCTTPASVVAWTITSAPTIGSPLARETLNASSFATSASVIVRAGQLMEAFLPNGVATMFTGDDTVGSTGQVADIVHAGAGLKAGSNMGAGNDLVIGSTGSVNVKGGNGDDTLIGSSAADVIDGEGGNDVVRGGLGADNLTPGAGFADVLSYDDPARGAPLVATFAGSTFPGNPDGDITNPGFEVLEGTPLGDSLSASTSGVGLRGAGGDDLLQGGPGVDTFDGGDGNDNVQAADGNPETVDCGLGLDITFSVDATDTVSGCEGTPPPPAPAAGGAATGGSTTPGARTTTPSLPAIGATLSSKFSLSGASTRVTTLTAKKLPAGSSLKITCTAPKGKSSACAFKTKTKNFTKSTASSALASLFKRKKLPSGTKIVVRVTAPGKAGKTFTFTTRKNKQPKLISS
jgi:Ca2+-binding RTX toxin-like protein